MKLSSLLINYPRGRFGGRHPLCGIGVTSIIVVTSRPAVCNERIAVSRPGPIPLTNTSTLRIPISYAAFPAASAAIPAANGVDFLLPLNPKVPADAQLTTFPSLSDKLTTVLLNVDLI